MPLLLVITCVLSIQMGHASLFSTSMFQELSNDIKKTSIQWVLTFTIAFWRFGVHWESNSQNGSSFGSVEVHFFTLSHTPGNIKCDSQTSLLARTLANPCLRRKPKARVTIFLMLWMSSVIWNDQNLRLKIWINSFYYQELAQWCLCWVSWILEA